MRFHRPSDISWLGLPKTDTFHCMLCRWCWFFHCPFSLTRVYNFCIWWLDSRAVITVLATVWIAAISSLNWYLYTPISDGHIVFHLFSSCSPALFLIILPIMYKLYRSWCMGSVALWDISKVVNYLCEGVHERSINNN